RARRALRRPRARHRVAAPRASALGARSRAPSARRARRGEAPSLRGRLTMKPFVVLGAGGMLGRAFVELLSSRGLAFEALTRAEVDVEDHDALRRRLGDRACTILNCAAYTDVDGAETDEARAFAVNARAVEALARHAEATGSVLVHFSTDYV